MKILHLNTYEKTGGAAIGTHRLHLALNAHTGITSIMGVLHKQSDSDVVFPLQMYTSRFVRILENRIYKKLEKKFASSTKAYFSSYLLPNNLVPAITALKPDIIHLHWIAHFISPWVLEKLSKLDIPVVWNMRDTWGFTGGCHFFSTCEKWQYECRECPIVTRVPFIDVVNIQWKCKVKAYEKLKPTIIAQSKQSLSFIKKSALFRDLSHVHLPNTINSDVFKPIGISIAKDILNLDHNKKYILFGAMSSDSDKNKGYDLLTAALTQLPENIRASAHCLIFGATKGAELPIPATFLGRLHDETTLALVYSAAHVFVCPSREESFSNTTLESLACGTPVVGFGIGGIPDMVDHKENGYVATPYETQDLTAGIRYVLENAERHRQLSQKARQKVEEHYAELIIAAKYAAFYESLLARKK